MNLSAFFQVISAALRTNTLVKTPSQSKVNQYFLKALTELTLDPQLDRYLKMTQATILFEGFYRHSNNDDLRKALLGIREKRWGQHYGVPTTTFLLTYKLPIEETKQLFDALINENASELKSPWLISKNIGLDKDNGVYVDPDCISRISVPDNRETIGVFTKTHNPSGGFTTAPCDPVSQKFIEHAAFTAQQGGKVLEIGAAFGAATLEALEKGATVFCNDIDPENLAVVQKRYLDISREKNNVTGDSENLVLISGELPEELTGLPKRFFDAILICRVLHFFSGEKIEKSLTLMSQLLAPGGKIYIVCETPYLKNWQRFIPEFNKRVEQHVKWPGEITNPMDYESSGRATSLPAFVHWITQEVLERSLLGAGFAVEYSEYINRA
jgi:SAM-dependent methyltransferase